MFHIWYLLTIDFLVAFYDRGPDVLIGFLQREGYFFVVFNAPSRFVGSDYVLEFAIDVELVCSLVSDFDVRVCECNVKLFLKLWKNNLILPI